jgi:putative DNA primase/helicase
VTVKATPAGVEEFFESATEAPRGASLNGHAPTFDPPNPMDPGDLISIDVACDHLPTMTSLSWEAIKKRNSPPVLFRHGTQIVRAARHPETQKAWLQEVTAEILRHELARWAHWHKNQFKLVKPPLDVIRDVLATKDMALPVLRRVVSVPVFGRSGALQTAPGYSTESGVLFVPDAAFEALPVPDPVTDEHVAAANKLLCGDVLVDFPFASDADRDNAVALFLLPFARDLIDGPTPCHLIEASMPSSGKTLLAELLTYPSVQEDVGLITPPGKEEEWVKQITTVLLNAKPVVLIDNVNSMLNSGALAAAWTARIWDQRVLGGHESANVPIRCVWVMTANNPSLSTELITR